MPYSFCYVLLPTITAKSFQLSTFCSLPCRRRFETQECVRRYFPCQVLQKYTRAFVVSTSSHGYSNLAEGCTSSAASCGFFLVLCHRHDSLACDRKLSRVVRRGLLVNAG